MQMRCSRCGSKASSTPSASLSPITPITPISGEKVKESSIAAAVAAAPWGLWAASSTIVGLRRMISSRPGEVTSAKAARTRSASSGSSPAKASTAASATAAFCAWCAPYSGRKTSSYRPRRPWRESIWPPDGGHPRHDAELHALAGDGGADLGGALDQHGGHVGLLLGEDGDASRA